MDRSEELIVTIGALLAGFGAVILGLLSHAAAFGVGSACVLAGLYLLIGIYLGWPLPTTAAERALAPNLQVHEARVLSVERSDVVVELAIANLGRRTVARAVINVLIANPVREVYRCTRDGVPHSQRGSSDDAPESLWTSEPESLWLKGQIPVPSTIWGGYLNFDGRGTRIMYLRVGLDSVRDFVLQMRITAIEMRKPVTARFEVTTQAVPSAREVRTTTDEPAS